jgi:hypothetical protein
MKIIMRIAGHSDFFPLLKRGIEEGIRHENRSISRGYSSLFTA